MVHTGNAPSPVRSDPDHPVPNGRLGDVRSFRQSDERHMDDSQTDAAKVRDHMGTGDRLAMVVQRIRKSSVMEKVIAGIFSVTLALAGYIAVTVTKLDHNAVRFEERLTVHLEKHPDVEIKEDIEGIHEDAEETNRILNSLDRRLLYLEYGLVPQDAPPE